MERIIKFKNLDTVDIKYLLGKGREVEEFYGCFSVSLTKLKTKIDASLPFAHKIVDGKEILMTVAEYFNTATSKSVYAQIRTSAVIDGVDKNTFIYANNEQLDKLIGMFTLGKIKDEATFKIEQVSEAKEIDEFKEIK